METKTTLETETIQDLQHVIRINLDSSKGFRAAADEVDNAPLAQFFRACADEREEMAHECQRLVGANGTAPEHDGSLLGAAHRWWLNIRGAIQDGDEHAVLAEAERGEDAIKHLYEKILEHHPGSAVNDVLQRQYAQIKSRHDQVRDMRDRAA